MRKRVFRAVIVATGDDPVLVAGIKKQGGRAVLLPGIAIKRLPLKNKEQHLLRQLPEYDWVLFTSKHAVHFFFAEIKRQHVPFPQEIRVGAVGPATASALRRAHSNVSVVPEIGTVNHLIKRIGTIRRKKILLPRSARASKETIRYLRKKGARVSTIPLYTIIPADIPQTKIKSIFAQNPDYLIFKSPSGIDGLLNNVKKAALNVLDAMRDIPAVCLGPTTAKAAKRNGFKRVFTAQTSTERGILDMLRKLP